MRADGAIVESPPLSYVTEHGHQDQASFDKVGNMFLNYEDDAERFLSTRPNSATRKSIKARSLAGMLRRLG